MEIVQLKKRPEDIEQERALKRLAVQIAAQLPEDTAEALAVLRHTENLIRLFLDDPLPA